jgi:hypothetical protein
MDVALDRMNLVHRVCRLLRSERRRDSARAPERSSASESGVGMPSFRLPNGRELDLAETH